MFVPGSSGFYDPASDVTFQGGLPQFDVPILPVVPQSSGMGLTGILLLAAAGGFAYWYFVYRKKGL